MKFTIALVAVTFVILGLSVKTEALPKKLCADAGIWDTKVEKVERLLRAARGILIDARRRAADPFPLPDDEFDGIFVDQRDLKRLERLEE